ncbi:MAG: SH3 domain-containing protein [Gammaproteobacteria bacterium]|nr:SH3 domain-containing protein [Gammaproteobacteria bacterium]
MYNLELQKFPWASCLILSLCLVNHSAFADRGDSLVITGDIVNLRSGPSIESRIVKRLVNDDEVIEISRYEDWVEVATNNKRLDYGWIHDSLMETIDGTPASSSSENEEFITFRTHFVTFIKKVESQTGITPFTEVEQLDAGSLQLTSSDDWISLDPQQRDNILSEVFDLWRNYVATGLSVLVEVIDENGEQHMMMFR